MTTISHRQTPISNWFLLIVGTFVTGLVIANIVAVKLVSLFELLLPASIVIFPLLYLLGTIITEIYGLRVMKQVIWLSFFCNLLAVTVIWIGQVLPTAPFWEAQGAYERILGYAPRLLVASFVSFLLGEFTNAHVLVRLRTSRHGQQLWVRVMLAMLLGQGLDTAVFSLIAFVGTMPLSAVVMLIVTSWLAKSLYVFLISPLVPRTITYLAQQESQLAPSI